MAEQFSAGQVLYSFLWLVCFFGVVIGVPALVVYYARKRNAERV
jgi:hypothetical protein